MNVRQLVLKFEGEMNFGIYKDAPPGVFLAIFNKVNNCNLCFESFGYDNTLGFLDKKSNQEYNPKKYGVDVYMDRNTNTLVKINPDTGEEV